jgi:ribosomal protein S6
MMDLARKGEDIMKKRWLTMALALIMVLGFTGGRITAQPAAPPPQGEKKQMTQERREELRKKIELIWQQKMTEKLGLTEEEKAKVFPLLHQYEERERALWQENRQLAYELEKMINNNASEKELKKTLKITIKALEENKHKLLEVREEGFHELTKILPVEKQAKYIVFQAHFKREMHNLIRMARHKARCK